MNYRTWRRRYRSACMLWAALGLVSTELSAQALATGAKLSNGPGTLVYCDGYEALACPAGVGSGTSRPLALELLSPATGESMSTQFRAGWPLIYRATVADAGMLGLGRLYGEQYQELQNYQFPEIGQGAAVVFADEDALWSYSVPPNPSLPRDERILPFYPDAGDVSRYQDDVAGDPDSHDPTARWALRPEFGGPLPRYAYSGVGGLSTVPQAAAPDGVQFGADDDFPGLVILSNVGVGRVLTSLAAGWAPVLPRQARNLAGFINSVGYELNDGNDRTSITAVMMVPRFLFSRIQLVDVCTGTVTFNGNNEPQSCAGTPLQRVDGGPPEPVSVNDESLVEVRAFIVEPVWSAALGRIVTLDSVTDMNNDGQLNAVDAELMGWRVLSNETVFSFRQIGTHLARRARTYAPFELCQTATRPDDAIPPLAGGAEFDYDIDGNGYSAFDEIVVCPPGGSGVTRPPR